MLMFGDRVLYRTNEPVAKGELWSSGGRLYRVTRTKTYHTEPWATIVVYGRPATLADSMEEFSQAQRDLLKALVAPLPVDWVVRYANWVRIAGGFFLAGLGVYLVWVGEPLSAGMIGVLLVYVFWPWRRGLRSDR